MMLIIHHVRGEGILPSQEFVNLRLLSKIWKVRCDQYYTINKNDDKVTDTWLVRHQFNEEANSLAYHQSERLHRAFCILIAWLLDDAQFDAFVDLANSCHALNTIARWATTYLVMNWRCEDCRSSFEIISLIRRDVTTTTFVAKHKCYYDNDDTGFYLSGVPTISTTNTVLDHTFLIDRLPIIMAVSDTSMSGCMDSSSTLYGARQRSDVYKVLYRVFHVNNEIYFGQPVEALQFRDIYDWLPKNEQSPKYKRIKTLEKFY